jgi:hypothetical protein
MNATLTWWGVSLAVLNKDSVGDAVISHSTMLRIVPIFVALLVWLIRVLIIGTFSVAGERLFNQFEARPGRLIERRIRGEAPQPSFTPLNPRHAASRTLSSVQQRPNTRAANFSQSGSKAVPRPEPTYHSLHSNAPAEQTSRAAAPGRSDSNLPGSQFRR